MAHFAEIDKDNKVIRVLAACNQDIADNGGELSEQAAKHFETVCPLSSNGVKWVQTSYNHNFRKKYAGIGDVYDPVKDKFLAQQPYASWSLDSSDDWQAPITYPTVTNDGKAGTEEDPNEWVYVISWNETKYDADNTKGWEALKSDDTSDTPTKYDWNGTAWVSA